MAVSEGHFVGVHLFGSLVVFFGEGFRGLSSDVFVDVHGGGFEVNIALETVLLGISKQIPPPHLGKFCGFKFEFVDLVELLFSQLLIKLFHHSKDYYIIHSHHFCLYFESIFLWRSSQL